MSMYNHPLYHHPSLKNESNIGTSVPLDGIVDTLFVGGDTCLNIRENEKRMYEEFKNRVEVVYNNLGIEPFVYTFGEPLVDNEEENVVGVFYD